MSAARIEQIIAISGKRGTGKTFLSNVLFQSQRKADVSVTIVPVANALKHSYCKHSGADYGRMLEDYTYKTQQRPRLLEYAAKIKAARGETYWIDCLLASVLTKTEKVIIIPDIRLAFELEKIRTFCSENNIKLETHRLEPPDGVRERRGYVYDAGIDSGIFETGLDGVSDWDFVHTENEFGIVKCGAIYGSDTN